MNTDNTDSTKDWSEDYPVGYTIESHGRTLTMTEDGWRAETKARHHRLRDWDYCRPWTYMITLNCQHHDRVPMPAEVQPAEEARLYLESHPFRVHPAIAALYAKRGKPLLFGRLTLGG